METIKQRIIVPTNHKVRLELTVPESIAPGEAEVLVVFSAKEKGQPRERQLGVLKGKVWMSDDFDEPLPDAFWLGE